MAARIGKSKISGSYLCVVLTVSIYLTTGVSGQIEFNEQDIASALARVTLGLFSLGGLVNQTEQLIAFDKPRNVKIPVGVDSLSGRTNSTETSKPENVFEKPKDTSFSIDILSGLADQAPVQETNAFFEPAAVASSTDDMNANKSGQEGNVASKPENVTLSLGVQANATEQERSSIENVSSSVDVSTVGGQQNSIELKASEGRGSTNVGSNGTEGKLNGSEKPKNLIIGNEGATIVKANYSEQERIRLDGPRPHYVKILRASLGNKNTSRPPTNNYTQLLRRVDKKPENVSSNNVTSINEQANYTETEPDRSVQSNASLSSSDIVNATSNSTVQKSDRPVPLSDKSENVSLSANTFSVNGSTNSTVQVKESARPELEQPINETLSTTEITILQEYKTEAEGNISDKAPLVKDSVTKEANHTEQKVDALDTHDKVSRSIVSVTGHKNYTELEKNALDKPVTVSIPLSSTTVIPIPIPIPISSTVIPVQIEQLQYTEQERKALDKFREMVSRDLTQNYQFLDSYLIRWLRYKNFDMDASVMMLQKNLKWRKDNNIDNILNEKLFTFNPPVYTNNGFDYLGRPVITFTPTVVDLRRMVASGQGDKVVRYWDQILEEAEHRIENASTRTGGNINKGISLMDLSAFNVRQHTCFGWKFGETRRDPSQGVIENLRKLIDLEGFFPI